MSANMQTTSQKANPQVMQGTQVTDLKDEAIVVDNFSKRYGSRRVVDQLQFTVHRGEVFALLGPNGAGKTTTVETLEGYRVPEGEVFQVIESPRGELGYYMVSDGTTQPYRVHMRTPSFGNLQATGRMVEGSLIADVIASIGSMDFVLGDTDR